MMTKMLSTSLSVMTKTLKPQLDAMSKTLNVHLDMKIKILNKQMAQRKHLTAITKSLKKYTLMTMKMTTKTFNTNLLEITET